MNVPLLLALVPQLSDPPLPPRDYQPRLFDPGMDGGINHAFMGNADFTPDGRILIGFRDHSSFPGGWPFRSALIAVPVYPTRMKEVDGRLDEFYTPSTGWPFFGSEFSFGSASIAGMEQARIHYGVEAIDSGGQIVWNSNYPIGSVIGNAHMTLALRPSEHGNPYPSDVFGVHDPAGEYRCYKLFLVRIHSNGFESYMVSTGQPVEGGGEPLVPAPPLGHPEEVMFVCQNITVVLDADIPAVVYTEVEPFPDGKMYADLVVGSLANGPRIHGIEPSLTVDGQLFLYHGNGSNDAGFAPGTANVTYVYNPTPCAALGWTAPRSITELPPELNAAQQAAFKLRYPLFAQTIRMSATSSTAELVIGPTETVRGTYPWVSRDGSFFVAKCAKASESMEQDLFDCDGDGDKTEIGPSCRTRAGTYVCGDLTYGYIKHIDDVGINPTRRGGQWDWPTYKRKLATDPSVNSWRAFDFSTGSKPGLWEPLLGLDSAIPTQDASARIPVLSMFENEIDSYGEIRFEEVDRNYMLYLACNEGLRKVASNPGESDWEFDLGSTPDTSGLQPRALALLNIGAGFPQQVAGTSETLRTKVADAVFPTGIDPGTNGLVEKLHECVGFKGQALAFNDTGKVEVSGAPGLGGMQGFTFQAFVKVVGPAPTSTITLFEHGGLQGSTYDWVLTLKLTSQKRFIATVSTTAGNAQVQSRANAVATGSNLYDPQAGWRHVAVTFSGGGSSKVRIYLDGILDKTAVGLSASTVRTPTGSPYSLLGPGRTTPSLLGVDGAKYLLDEVAMSDVIRSSGELRRDAYVAQLGSGFEDWPPPSEAPALPSGLESSDAFWPVGVDYSADVIGLGQSLFVDPILSPPAIARSCSTCHDPAHHFASPTDAQFELDVSGQPLRFNTPTVLNAVFGSHKLFDGGAKSIEDQVWRPILSGLEMGTQTQPEVLARLNLDDPGDPDDYYSRFHAVFSEDVDADNVAQALAMYIRTLNTGDHPLSAQAEIGKGLFFGKARCFGCHRGSGYTDNDFHNVLTVDMPLPTSETIREDFTGRVADEGRVKTPTLRNVLGTRPYFHDGSKATLRDVVEHYNAPPFDDPDRGVPDVDLRPLGLTSSEIDALVAFLEAL